MREIRQSGSEGEMNKPLLPTPICNWLLAAELQLPDYRIPGIA